ncbi:predicted protein [Postia placenta Mad-698-R]|nr:predicted protein [Postia placenta Mad-698-R]
MSGHNWRWVFPIWLFGMVPVGTNIVFATNVGVSKVMIITRGSVVVSDILVIVATWYYISRTSSVRTQLVRDIWTARPNLTTVMFRDVLKYSEYNKLDYSFEVSGDTSTPASYRMTSILISRFLICIREAAERSTQAFSSQSLSFVDSQGNSSPQPWLSSAEFVSDIINRSAEDSLVDAFPNLDDNNGDLNSGGGEEAQVPKEDEDGIEMGDYATGGQRSPSA